MNNHTARPSLSGLWACRRIALSGGAPAVLKSEASMIELRPCSVCKGPACTEQIDSSIGVLTAVQCADTECNGHWNNGWFEDEDDAIAWWNDRQIGVAAMNHVLPFNEVPA